MRVQDSGQGERRPRSYASLAEFFGRGEFFVRQLIAENERLRGELNGEHERSEPGTVSVLEQLMARVGELERELDAAQEREVSDASTFPAAASFTPGVNAANDLPQRVEQLEHENYHLASMYVAGLQFHSARTLPEVLQTITEILLNFVGIGAFTLFVLDEERQVLFALAREGGDLEAVPEVGVNDGGPVGGAGSPASAHGGGTAGQAGPGGPGGLSGPGGPISAMIQRARPWTRGDPAYADDNAIMYLPLVSNRRLVAVLRLESFLAQKPGFDDNDFSLLSMISEHAGIAIETAWIRAHAKAVALQRQAVEQLVGA